MNETVSSIHDGEENEIMTTKTATKKSTKKRAPKKAPADKPQEIRPGDIWPVGTSVRYTGGSKAKGLKTGEIGTLGKRYGKATVRYAVRFEKRLTVLGAQYLEKLPSRPAA